ncbi:PHB depolymerase family esterase [Amycolatopsis sp. cg5]|uniref:alpha/beta hydrolase family esterase n=1 Tax=Amycolatopsis sp. cg5 TaxID=3238802 RepID=UPI003524E3D2
MNILCHGCIDLPGGKMRRTFALLIAALATLPLVSACNTAVASTSAAAASSGCGKTAPYKVGASTNVTLSSGGRNRKFRVHLPTAYSKDQPLSLALSFHGHGSTMEFQEQLTGFSKLKTIAVYPQGETGTDGRSAWQGAPYSAKADDVQFTKDLLTTLEKALCVDTHRIYASGKSNGGGFTGLLACRLADRIAAFAPVAGAFYSEAGACNPTRHVPIKDFHGTADTVIPYTGNPDKGLPSIPSWLAAWAVRDGCDGSTSRVEGRVTYRQWQGCSLEHVKIDGLGHDWPAADPDASALIWQFFTAHPLP